MGKKGYYGFMHFHDPTNRWCRLDNYFKGFLQENPKLKEGVREKILHFMFQYLSKVGNVHAEEAAHVGRDVSPWRSTIRDDYQRVYWQYNEPLRAIEFEISKAFGIDRRIILINDQPLKEEFLKHLHEYKGQRFLTLPEVEDFYPFIKMVVRGGYTLSLQETAQVAVRFGIDQANPTFLLPEKEDESIDTLEDFLCHPLVQGFCSDEIRVLLEGFKTIPLEQSFAAMGISELLKSSFQRALLYLKTPKPKTWQDQYVFENACELIHEEMLFWLMMTEPYSLEDFRKALLKMMPNPDFYRATQSGMAALSEVTKTLLLESHQVVYFDDCYFESIDLFETAKTTVIRFPDYSLSNLPEGIDLFFVDFHNNFVERKMETQRHDILSMLPIVLPKASKNFCLIIDLTIGTFSEIEPILKNYPDLNLIVYWSHQKLDMFGTDKFNAGGYAVYSKNRAIIEKFEAIEGGDIDWVTVQGMTHFFIFGSTFLRKRAERIFANAEYVQERIAPHIQNVVRKRDPMSFSIDVQGAWTVADETRVLVAFRSLGVPILTRPSFGYNQITFICICDKILRFSIGTEEEPLLDLFIDAFNTIFLKEPKTSKRVPEKLDVALDRA